MGSTPSFSRRHRRIRRHRTLGALRREAKAAGHVDPDTWQAVIEFYGGRCAYCGLEWRVQDHVIPIARGGQHCISNVVPACDLCNFTKGTQTWAPRRRHPWMETIP